MKFAEIISICIPPVPPIRHRSGLGKNRRSADQKRENPRWLGSAVGLGPEKDDRQGEGWIILRRSFSRPSGVQLVRIGDG